MNMFKNIAIFFIFLVGMSLQAVEVGSDECKLTHDSPISKFIRATYRSLVNQMCLTIFLVAELKLTEKHHSTSLSSLYGSWILLREIVGQLKQEFEGVPYVSNTEFTATNYLLINIFLPYGINLRTLYSVN